MWNALSDWLGYWRLELHKFGILAMDLSNHPRDRLATHCVVLFLEKRPGKIKNRARSFCLLTGSVCTREEVIQILRDHDCSEENVDSWRVDVRGPDTLQMAIFAEGLVRFLWVSFRDIDARRRIPPETSRKIADGWESAAIACINDGEPLQDEEDNIVKK